MAKKSKKNKHGMGIPVIPSKVPSKVPAKPPGMIKTMLGKAGIEMNPEIVSKLNADQTLELQDLIETLNLSISQNEEIQSTVESKQKELETSLSDFQFRQKTLEKEHSVILATRKEIEEKEKDLLKRESNCSKSEINLLEREANAQAEFSLQRQSSLEEMKANFSTLQYEINGLEQKRINIEIDDLSQRRQQMIDFKSTLHDKLSNEIEHLNTERKSFERLQNELRSEKIVLDELKQNINTKQDQQKLSAQQLRSDLTNDFKSKEQQLTQEIQSLNEYRQRDLDKIKLLQEKISGFGELEREATLREFAHPSDVLKHIDTVEQELRDARQKLKGRSESDLEDDLGYYKELAEEKSESLEELQKKHQEAKVKIAKNQLSVREKLELQTQNSVLELHNQALKSSIDSLKMTLDDLIEKQQSQEAFSELLLMDRKFSEPSTATKITSLKEFTDDLQHRIAQAEDTVLYYDIKDIQKFVAGLAMSQLHVFEGISGTGKTSLVKAFAKAVGGHVTTVPVQAGWRDRDDLVGHYNAFEKRYYEKECLQGLYRAHTPRYINRFNVILLDEMNLSRPEQYFAEFLSALEMRDGERNIVLMDSSTSNAPKYFVDDRKIPLANNTWFMGTANHDETTFEFADKTHDRSFMMELKRQDMPKNWQPQKVDSDPIDITSVKRLFDEAESDTTIHSKVTELLTKLKHSEFGKLLENDFKVGWGNRFEGQAHRFMSVYMSCGGKAVEALEHLLITRVLRKGKVLGRFDISHSKLENLNIALEQLLGPEATVSSEILLVESELKAEGAF